MLMIHAKKILKICTDYVNDIKPDSCQSKFWMFNHTCPSSTRQLVTLIVTSFLYKEGRWVQLFESKILPQLFWVGGSVGNRIDADDDSADDIMLARICEASNKYLSKELVIGMAILSPFPFHHYINLVLF